ncbi:universal stress protein [Thalassiella azotivora]
MSTDTTPSLRSVVVGFDGSASARLALTWAVGQCGLRDVPLTVVAAVDDVPRYPDALSSRTSAAQQVVEEAVAEAEKELGEGRVRSVVQAGEPAVVLLTETGPEDLLVIGSHGHGLLGRLLLGSTAGVVVPHARGPVAVVRGQERPEGPVVVGVDGSGTAQRAVAFAADLAARFGAPLLAEMAVPPVTDALGRVSGPDEPALQQARADLAECVAGLAESHPDVVVETDVTQSHPLEALTSRSGRARAVVVGSRGRGAFEAALLGSVGRGLVQHADCPVLVVR